MKFKVGDRVKIVDDGYLWIHQEDIAKGLNLTKWKCGYGAWYSEDGASGDAQDKEGVILSIIDESNPKHCMAGVELDNENIQIVIEVKGLELVEEELKFKVGDVIKCKGCDIPKFRVIQIAEKGERVKGPWESGDEEFEVPAKAYILADDRGQWTFSRVANLDEYELVEIEEKPLKFKVGDVIKFKGTKDENAQIIVQIAEKGETVEGPWLCGGGSVEVSKKAYILEDENGHWGYSCVIDEDEKELVNTEKELEGDNMNQCITCKNADPACVGDFMEERCSESKKLVWCKEKLAWVSQDRVEICFKKAFIPCRACGEAPFFCRGHGLIQARCSANTNCGVRSSYKHTEEEAEQAWAELNKV